MNEKEPDIHVSRTVVQAKLLARLKAGSHVLQEPDWSTLPQILASHGLVLQGLPTLCAPVVINDKVQGTLMDWTREQITACKLAIDQFRLKIVQRLPIARRVIFEMSDANGTLHESTLGFSEQWILKHLFVESLYEQFTQTDLKTMNVKSYTTILESVGIPLAANGLPWIALPGKLWNKSCYLSGLPRCCVPKVVNDRVLDDTSVTLRWTKEKRMAFQRSADFGLLKILPRAPDRQVIFEVLEADESLKDDCCGFSDQWKAKNDPFSKDTESNKKKKSETTPSTTPTSMIASFPWQPINGMMPQPVQPPSKRATAAERYATFLRIHGLLIDAPDGPAFVYVPQMLATRRCIIQGLPRPCLPIVRDDDVVANYDPRQWSLPAVEAFLQAFDGTRLYILPNPNRSRVLYRVVTESGDIVNETIGFSEKWQKENLDPIDLSGRNVPPSTFVIEMWLSMLESVNIPCYDYRGRRRIPWIQLPQFLANRRGYVSGCPVECHPVIEDDIVSELSSPYFWDDNQLRLMTTAFVQNKVSVCSRKAGRNVIFTREQNGKVFDSVLRFSGTWVQTNLHAIPNSIANPIAFAGFGPFIPVIPNPPVAPVQPKKARPKPSSNHSNSIKRTRESDSPVTSHSTPVESSSTSSFAPFQHSQTSTSSKEGDSFSTLKLIIPPFKRRNMITQKETAVNEALVKHHSNGVAPPEPVQPRPRRSHPLPSTSPLHTMTTRRVQARYSTAVALEPPLLPSPSTSEDDKSQAFEVHTRTSMSPPLPPKHTLPNPLPSTPVPTFLPIPGGNLIWTLERKAWEVTVSEAWPPEEWKKRLPVFPARILWNPAQAVWMCEPSITLSRPGCRLSPALENALEASKSTEALTQIDRNLSIIWHRWRRSWGLFEFVSPFVPRASST